MHAVNTAILKIYTVNQKFGQYTVKTENIIFRS